LKFSSFYIREDEQKGLDKSQTLDLIKSAKNDWNSSEIISKGIISEWVIEQINECLSNGSYPTNTQIGDWIEKNNDLSLSDNEKNNLGSLIYLAKQEIIKRRDKVEGLKYYSEKELESLLGKEFEIKLDTLLGAQKVIGKLIKVKDKYGLQPKRMRTKYYPVYPDTKLKLVGE